MWPDRVSNPGPLTSETGALPTALRGPPVVIRFRQQTFSDKGIDIIKGVVKILWRHFDIVSKYNVGLKTLLLQGLSRPEFYGDLVYKFRKIIGNHDFPYHFKKIIVRYKRIGYNILLDVLRQTACLVVIPIKVNSFRNCLSL